MEDKTIKILLIEDNADDVELIKRKLDKSVYIRFSVTPVRNLHDALEHLNHNETELILSDLGLPDSHGESQGRGHHSVSPGAALAG